MAVKQTKKKYITGSNENNKYMLMGGPDMISAPKLADALSDVMVSEGADPDLKIPIRLSLRKNAVSSFGKLSEDGKVSVYIGAIASKGSEIIDNVPEVDSDKEAVMFTALYVAALIESVKPGNLKPGEIIRLASTPEFMFARRHMQDIKDAYKKSPAYERSDDKDSIFNLMKYAKKRISIDDDSPADDHTKSAQPETTVISSQDDDIGFLPKEIPPKELDIFSEGEEAEPEPVLTSVVEKAVDTSTEIDGLADGNESENTEPEEHETPEDEIKEIIRQHMKPAPKAKEEAFLDKHFLEEHASFLTSLAPVHEGKKLKKNGAMSRVKTKGTVTVHDIAVEIDEAMNALFE